MYKRKSNIIDIRVRSEKKILHPGFSIDRGKFLRRRPIQGQPLHPSGGTRVLLAASRRLSPPKNEDRFNPLFLTVSPRALTDFRCRNNNLGARARKCPYARAMKYD